jgi:hypothetical protein
LIGYAEEIRWVFDTLAVRREEAALLAEIAAPRMNLLGPALVRELVSAIRGAEAIPPIRCSCSRASIPTTSSPTSL